MRQARDRRRTARPAGALLTLRYSAFFAHAFTTVPPQKMQALGDEAAAAIADSFGGAADVAKNLPQADAATLMSAAEQAFTEGSHLAIAVAIAAALGGLALVLVAFPGKAAEQRIEDGYAADEQPAGATGAALPAADDPATGAPPSGAPAGAGRSDAG